MLYRITDRQHPYWDLIKDDPVRPAIPQETRLHEHADVFVLVRDSKPAAVTCVAYLDRVPKTERELGDHGDRVAAFYTIWSYQPGAGRELIQAARAWIQLNRQSVIRYVTLSPKTEMARRFHHNNGAKTISDNDDTVNYEYE